MKSIYILLSVLIVLIGYLIYKEQVREPIIVQSDTLKVIDTVYIEGQSTVSTSIQKMETKTIVIDSTKYIDYTVLLKEALEYYKDSLISTPKNFIAQKDTVVGDSLVKVNIHLSSPLPFHPNTIVKSTLDYKLPVVKETITVTNTIVKTPLLTYGLSVGGGYGMVNSKWDMWIGVGLMFNLGKLL